MSVSQTVVRQAVDGSRALKRRWRSAALAAGWAFADDWSLAEVDDVCEVVLGSDDPSQALAGLGAARAESGAGLAETLLDLAALHAVLVTPGVEVGAPRADVDAVPAKLLRATALGWAEVVLDRSASTEAEDPLTGLATAAYLRTRLREVYAATPTDYALLFVSLDLDNATGWSRVVAMTLLADALRGVFDAGESVASVGPSVAAVLLRRDADVEARLDRLAAKAEARLAVDPHVNPAGPAKLVLRPLPDTYEEVSALLATPPRTG
ncbi:MULTISPECIES: GGDEF domain-containing protein [Actinosynnema]|uniref:GGDEF domain-containing protein n=1 Tax=Actinosynnema TaxID=40566 RepID=UPI0020A3E0CC|nr:GGDEF domain-containing protein [Actinosynnema pretiosum]MCP2099630.1 hypothetical protein [Actinosynnema pretiosum]